MRNPRTNPFTLHAPTHSWLRLVPIVGALLVTSAATAPKGGRTDDSGWDTTTPLNLSSPPW